MRKILCLILLVPFLVTGCLSTGAVDPNMAGRIAADAACALGLGAQGAAIASGMGAAEAIAYIASQGQTNPALAAACAQMVSNLAQDIAAGKVKADGLKYKKPQ